MNTKTIDGYVKYIHTLCDNEVSNEEMFEYLTTLSKKCPSLRYDNSIFWVFFVGSLILVAILYYLYGDTYPEYLVGGSITALICVIIIYNRYKRIKHLNKCLKNLYEKNLLNVRKIPIQRNLRKMFFEFTRGNYANKIIQASRAKDNSFDLICYNWVDKHYITETRTNKQGKVYTVNRVSYENFYRDGIVFSTNIYNNIWIQSFPIYDGGKTWTTSYERFNKNFIVKCDEELSAAKVLTPPVVLHIHDISKIINNLNIELRDNGFGLISIPEETLRTNQELSVDNILNLAMIFKNGKNESLELLLKLKNFFRK